MTFREHMKIARRAWKTTLGWDRGYVLALLGAAVFSSVTPFVPVYFSARLVDGLFAGEGIGTLFTYAGLTVGLVFLFKLLETRLTTLKEAASTKAYQREGWSYADKSMEMDLLTLEDPGTVRLRERIRMETQTGYNRYYLFRCMEGIVKSVTRIVSAAAMSASFFALGSLSVWIRLGLAAGILATVAVSVFSQMKEERIMEEFDASCVDVNALSFAFYRYSTDYAAGKDIRMYCMGPFLCGKDRELGRSFFRKKKKATNRAALWTLPGSFAEGLLRIGLYAALLASAFAGGVSAGSIAKYAACILLLLNGTEELVKSLQKEWINHEYLARYFSWFDLPNRMRKGSLTVEKRDDCDYEIEFRNVSFRYPGAEEDALKDVSLTFKIGEKLALVGENGSGKTTFIKLLTRLYDPREGEILLNGVDIRKYDYEEYLGVFSVVFQDFKLFPFRLGEVVAAAREYDEERVRESLRKANFGERLGDFPGGLGGYLYKSFDESGVEISGGEAQKIALARALYKDAPFILLDEPTAALDPESEYEVYSNFNAISGDKTTVYISHRLASCRFCDKIAVFDHGRIVEVGDHRTLLEKGGKYQTLWNAQAQYYRENAGEA